MKHFLKYCLFLMFSLSSFSLSAYVTTFRGMSMADGLSDLLVNVIFKDSIGFVWLGTDNCLDRFDGVNIKHYPFNNADVKRTRVTAIAETDFQYLWIGNGLGLWRLNRETDQMEHIVAEIIDCAVSSLLYDKEGRLYIGTEKGLFIHEAGRFERVMLDSNILSSANHIVALEKDNQNMIWLITSKELYAYHPETKEIIRYVPDNTSYKPYIFRCITHINQTIYLGTANMGIVQFDIQQKKFSNFIDVGCNIISSISTDGKDMIYTSTDGNGIHFLSHSQRKIIQSYRHDTRDKSSIRSNSVYSLLVDKENIIWMGFYQAGFDYSLYQSALFTVYDFPPMFDSMNMQVRSFLIHDSEKLIGTRDGLFYINESTQKFKSFLTPTLRANLILSIARYEDEYYIGTYGGGLSILHPGSLSVSNFPESEDMTFLNGHIFCLKPDREGNLWMGTSDGVYCYHKENKSLRTYTHTNSQLPEGNVYEIFFDSTNKGWFCTENGMALYDQASKSIKVNVFPENFVHREKIRSIYEDSQQQLHFLPDKGSMLTSDLAMNSFYRTPMNPIFHGNSYMSIVEDDERWIWLGCDGGLIRTKEGAYSVYNFSDGIPNPTFTNNAAYKDENGYIWLGNAKGLIYVNPENIHEIRRNLAKIVITELRVNGILLDAEKRQKALSRGEILFKHNQNNVTFGFANLSYTDPATMVYEYKLEGFEKDWKQISGLNNVSYFDLPSGSYVFRVRILGDEISEVSIRIITQPMFPVWFWIVLILVVILLYWRGRSWIIRMKRKPIYSDITPLSIFVTNDEKYKTNRLTTEECDVLLNKLSEYMKKEKPYTNPDLKIADLAIGIDASSHSLSYLFNQHLNQSYYDFINEYRIMEFKKLVKRDEYSRYTLSALAELCGFSSRASFFRSFKKITKITPNEYIRSIGATNE